MKLKATTSYEEEAITEDVSHTDAIPTTKVELGAVTPQELKTMSDKGLILSNLSKNPESFDKVIGNISKLVDSAVNKALAIKTIEDPEQYTNAKVIHLEVSKIEKEVEKQRKSIKEPYKKAVDLIDGRFKELAAKFSKPLLALQATMLKWENVAAEKQRKLQEEEDRKATEAIEKAAQEKLRNEQLTGSIFKLCQTAIEKMIKHTIKEDLITEAKNLFDTLSQPHYNTEGLVKTYNESMIAKIKNIGKLKRNLILAVAAVKSAEDQKKYAAMEAELNTAVAEFIEVAQEEHQAVQDELAIDEMNTVQSVMAENSSVKNIINASSSMSTSNKSYRYEFEVQDFDKIPKDWLILDEMKVRAYMDKQKVKGNPITKNTIVNGVLIKVFSKIIAR